VVILVNPSAGGGRALGRLKKIQPRLRELLGPTNLIFLGDSVRMQERVSRMLSEGHKEFIAAGGDGTVNLLLKSIMEKAPPPFFRA
jgi:diacylglycerol kinase family enzyme